jgi:hypothetical protein
MAYVCSQRTPKIKINYFMIGRSTKYLFKEVLETCLSTYNDSRIYLLDMKHIWNKNAFWDVNNKKWRKWC